MVTCSHIHKVYTNYLNWALSWLRKKGYPVNPSITILTQEHDGDVIVTMKEALYCKEWFYRHGSTEKIDILATITETIQLKGQLCKKSSLLVNYFRIEGRNRAIPTESLRYDCVLPPMTQHPICHVQSSNKLLDLAERPDSFNRNRTIVNERAIRDRCQTMRIPSAFVNLPGLLVILTASHLKEEHWREFMTECSKNHFSGFPCLKHNIVDKGIPDSHLCAWGWYER